MPLVYVEIFHERVLPSDSCRELISHLAIGCQSVRNRSASRAEIKPNQAASRILVGYLVGRLVPDSYPAKAVIDLSMPHFLAEQWL